GTNIIFRKEISSAADPEAERARRVEEFRKLIDPYRAAGAALIDDVIDPRETRPTLIRALEMAATKKVERPWKKHGVVPVWAARRGRGVAGPEGWGVWGAISGPPVINFRRRP